MEREKGTRRRNASRSKTHLRPVRRVSDHRRSQLPQVLLNLLSSLLSTVIVLVLIVVVAVLVVVGRRRDGSVGGGRDVGGCETKFEDALDDGGGGDGFLADD